MSSNKKTTSKKLNKNSKQAMKFKTSPLIPVIAVVEVLVLLIMSTYAWFAVSGDKSVNTNLITVDPDSGLEIDFYQSDTDYINIQDYLHNFEFEPATSLDGKNIYFPTTGTFKETNTNSMVFRHCTANDVNSKYVSINFSLTNTDPEGNAKTVTLSNKSYFKINDENGLFSGKALRMALYRNDGTDGAVRSSVLSADGSDVKKTIFFRNNLNWDKPCIYTWGGAGATPTLPGYELTQISKDLYYFTYNKNDYQNFLFTNGAADSFDNPAMRQTVDISAATTTSGTIFAIGDESNEYAGASGNKKYLVTKDTETYASLGIIDDEKKSYPVISPGVSAGFQRQYAPVLDIDNSTGAPTSITPAFASSFDDYLYGNEKKRVLFEIPAGETVEMSLIIWLEGTDPDCTGETYAGNNVEMNFVFSVGKGEDTTYKYRFYDKTKEYWTDDQLTHYGIAYNPVIQLYDEIEHRGYKMTFNKAEKYWECTAPASLIDGSKHQLNFRRVNPIDEDMVWNYWYAGSVGNGTPSLALDPDSTSTDHIYSFTAFANGAPEKYKVKISNTKYDVTNNPIANSCGGAWGKIATEIITFVDASAGHWIYNSEDIDPSGIVTVGTVTIKYNYKGKDIEYASSGDGNRSMYHFVVPKDVYYGVSRPEVSFRRYYNFHDATAINNSAENPNLVYDREWEAGKIGGKFYQYGESSGGAADNRYWGGDILYVQATSTIMQANPFMKVSFKPESGSNHYSYLNSNDSFKGDIDPNVQNGFICVIPADRKYTSYQVERCNPNDHSTRWNYTHDISLDYVSATSDEHAYNKVKAVSESSPTGGYKTLYFTNKYKWSKVYANFWGGTSSDGDWPGVEATFAYTNNDKEDVYVVSVPSDTPHLKFNDGKRLDQGGHGTKEINNTNSAILDGNGWYPLSGDSTEVNFAGWATNTSTATPDTKPANLCKLTYFTSGKYLIYNLYSTDWISRANLPGYTTPTQ